MKNLTKAIFVLILSCGSISLAGYRVWNDANAVPRCFRTDTFGTIFGAAISDVFCHFAYVVAPDSNGVLRCFNSDTFGEAYGTAVSDDLCVGP